jgi:hypothetical protein
LVRLTFGGIDQGIAIHITDQHAHLHTNVTTSAGTVVYTG